VALLFGVTQIAMATPSINVVTVYSAVKTGGGALALSTQSVDITPISSTAVTFTQNGGATRFDTANDVFGVIAWAGGATGTVTACRPIKVGNSVKGFYAYVSAAEAYVCSVDGAYFAGLTTVTSSSDPIGKALNAVLDLQAGVDSVIAADDVNATDKGVTLTVTAANGVLSNDVDSSSHTLKVTQFVVAGDLTTYTLAGGPPATAAATVTGKGTFTLNADGSYVLAPLAGFSGAFPVITYTVSDAPAAANTDTATLTITVKAIPTLSVTNSPQTYNGAAQAATVSGSVAGVVSNVKYGGSSTAPTNAGTYAVTADFVPTDTANYTTLTGASAGNFVINPRAITVTADAKSKTYGTTDPALSSRITSGSLAGGDSLSGGLSRAAGEDVGGYGITQGTLTAGTNYTLTYSGATLSILPATPTITWNNPDAIDFGTPLSSTQLNAVGSVPGTLTYSPAAGVVLEPGTYTLSVTFTPSSANYVGPISATVTLLVRLPPAPAATNDAARALEASGVNNGTPGSDPSGNVLSNDSGTSISVQACGTTSVSATDVTIAGSYGRLTIKSDGSFTYAVNQTLPAVEALNVGQSLTENFNYTIVDRFNRTAAATLSIVIDGADDAPVAVPVAPQTAVTGRPFGPLTIAPFTDVDNATLTYTVSGLPPGLSFDPITRTFSGTPTLWGPFEITITGSDGLLSASTKFTLNVTAPPVNALPSGPMKFKSDPAKVVGPDGTTFMVSDRDSPILTVTLSAEHGFLTLPSLTGLTLLEGSGFNESSLRFRGTIEALNAALAKLIYQAPTGYFGLDAITITTVDELGNTDIDKTDPPFSVELATLGGNTATATIGSLASGGRQVVSGQVTSFDRSILRSAQILGDGGNGRLSIGTPTRQDGSVQITTVKVEVTYSDGTKETFDIQVTVYNPKLNLVTQLALNPQTSLYEQKVQITNTTPYIIDSFRLIIPVLPAGVTLYSRSSALGDGRSVIEDQRPMGPAETRLFIIEYFAPNVQRFTEPQVILEINSAGPVASPIGATLPVDRVVVGAQNRTYLEFKTENNRTYWVQYRDGASALWQTSPVAVNGTGTTIHWLDEGWPKTLSAPTASREYRLVATNGVAAPLVFVAHPESAQPAIGAAASFRVTMGSGGPYTYQWYRDGQAIAGATAATYAVAKAALTDEAQYYVTVSDGRSTANSQSATLKLASGNPGRIANLSVRAQLDGSGQPLITGFVMTGTGSRSVLVRAVGDALRNYGVTTAVQDTALKLYRGSTILAENDQWNLDVTSAQTRAVSSAVGAFALPESSRDAAVVRRLLAETYTLHTSNLSGRTGIALTEVYDAASAYDGSNRITNVSSRAKITGGDGVIIAGLVITGDTTCRLLARVVGPTLSTYGVANPLLDPVLSLYASDSATPLATNDDWAAAQSTIVSESLFRRVGAFELPNGSKDSVIVLRLKPGVYTLVAQGKGAASGEALVEAYLID
jgi:VCBS repeat-containing protein